MTNSNHAIKDRRSLFNQGRGTLSANIHISALKELSLALSHEIAALENRAVLLNGPIKLADEVRKFETGLICNALIRTGGRQRQAARLLGMKITTLNAKIKRYNIDWAMTAAPAFIEKTSETPLLRIVK